MLHFLNECPVRFFVGPSNVALDIVWIGRGEECACYAWIAYGVLHGEFLDGVALFVAVGCSFGTRFDERTRSRMPVGHTSLCEQSHAEWRSVDDAYAVALEEVEEVDEFIVVETEVAEVEHALNGAWLTMLDDPLEVFELEVGDADMAHDSLLL